MSKVTFIFKGSPITIQCSLQDTMKEIGLRFTIKAQVNLDDIYFIYCGTLVSLDLKLNQIINSFDSERNEINVLVYEKVKEGMECPHCGKHININEHISNNNSNLSNELKETLTGLKLQLENIIKINNLKINDIIYQLKNMIIVINNTLQEMKTKAKIKINPNINELENSFNIQPIILKSIGMENNEENYIKECVQNLYKNYLYNFEEMDYEFEEKLKKKYEGNFVYSIYREGQGASYGCHNNKFFKLKYSDLIFKVFFQNNKIEN